jgi:hypothetical protein
LFAVFISERKAHAIFTTETNVDAIFGKSFGERVEINGTLITHGGVDATTQIISPNILALFGHLGLGNVAAFVTFALAFDDVEAAFGVELIFNFSDPLPIILMVILHTSFDVWHVDDEMIVKHVPLTVDMGVDRHLVVGRNTFCQFDPDVMASLPVVGIGGVKIFNPKD